MDVVRTEPSKDHDDREVLDTNVSQIYKHHQCRKKSALDNNGDSSLDPDNVLVRVL